MKPLSPAFSPISLRYVAALRGHKPKSTAVDFTYADAACAAPDQLICLAASNPEGRFYGFVGDEAARRNAEEHASQRGVFNTIFLVGSPTSILTRLANGSALPPMLDYLCCDESLTPLADAERVALFDLAEKRLNPGGILATTYRAYAKAGEALGFVIRELAPEMNDDQKQEFLTEIKKLATTYLSGQPVLASTLDSAIIKGAPDSFLSLFQNNPVKSATFDTMVALGGRGMAYAGDANLTANYVELSVPVQAQELVVKCRGNILYEPIKDVALNRLTRSDIWVKAPFDTSVSPAELFGGFAYGITVSRNEVPPSVAAQGKVIDLSGPLYIKLIELMTVMPIGIGDFLSHPSGINEKPEKIVEALQILVACGIANPMRGLQRQTANLSSVAQPRLVGSFNRYLDKTSLDDKDVWLASPVMGCGLSVSPREALVMQALNRAGLSNSVSALMPELRRIAGTAAGQTVIEAPEPTAEMAQQLIRDIVGRSLPQWYAYGLLEAA